MKPFLIAKVFCVIAVLPLACWAQVNTGSTGSDGPFNPTANTVINMADHLNGIYHYSSVYVPTNVTVTFAQNTNNAPVIWLVAGDVHIDGTVDLSGSMAISNQGAEGGPGGYRGGDGRNGDLTATSGQGPGGGAVDQYGTFDYGNVFLVPLLGGSGAGGSSCGTGGGGGGGAILIAAGGFIRLNGAILSKGGSWGSPVCAGSGVSGSGGAVRLVASEITGIGRVDTLGPINGPGDDGRVRFDSYKSTFSGNIIGKFTRGFQAVIIPNSNQLPRLTVTSVGGVPVSISPSGQLATPDAILSAQQNNPMSVTVQCVNLPLNTGVTVTVKPANGLAVSGAGFNTSGSFAVSTAIVNINMPRGGGLIYATATTSN